MSIRVNPRGVPKSLAGVPTDRMTLERIKLRVTKILPPRPLECPLSDLLAHAYMAGFVDGITRGGTQPLDVALYQGDANVE